MFEISSYKKSEVGDIIKKNIKNEKCHIWSLSYIISIDSLASICYPLVILKLIVLVIFINILLYYLYKKLIIIIITNKMTR